MNPAACAAQGARHPRQGGTGDRRIAIVSGDDLLPRLDELLADGPAFTNLDTGEPLATVRARLVSANAYLGSQPIVEALRQGASIVITGPRRRRLADLAPAVHEFGWAWDDWDRLAAAPWPAI